MTETETLPADIPQAEAEEPTLLDLCDLHGVEAEWHPSTEAEVNWVLEKINGATDRITGITAEYEATAARLKENFERLVKVPEAQRKFFVARYEADLQAFAWARLAEAKGKSKTIPLLAGKLSFRTSPARIKLDPDMTRLVAWARETGHDGFVKTTVTETVNRTDIAKELIIERTGLNAHGEVEYAVVHRSTGEVVPVAEIVPEEEKFTIA